MFQVLLARSYDENLVEFWSHFFLRVLDFISNYMNQGAEWHKELSGKYDFLEKKHISFGAIFQRYVGSYLVFPGL